MNIIDLGIENNWSKDTYNSYKELFDMKLPNTYKVQTIDRCYKKYSFEVLLNEQVHTVIYEVDSSD